jgi:uncharacterized protein DUF4277
VEHERELVVRTAGALPVAKDFCDRLAIAAAADRFCPIRAVADYSHGQVLEALVANRLTHPRPLSSFEDWGERFAVQEVLGIAPCKLNDDRLGRTLDAVSEHLDEILNLAGRRAVELFGLDLAELHWDVTQLSFTGSYDEQESGHALVKGPSKNGFWQPSGAQLRQTMWLQVRGEAASGLPNAWSAGLSVVRSAPQASTAAARSSPTAGCGAPATPFAASGT